MTGPERTELYALREDIRDFRKEVNGKLDDVGGRVTELEIAHAKQMGSDDAERRLTQERRWRLGLLFGVASSAAVGLLNLVMTHPW